MHNLVKLKQLRTLVISKLIAEFTRTLCASIEQMNKLEFLYLISASDDDILDLQTISYPPRFLRCLAYEGKELHVEEGGFPKLKLLEMRKLNGLNGLRIDDGALPLLEKLRLGPSPLVKEIPHDIKHLRNLKLLHFYDMPNEFVLKAQPQGSRSGPDYHKVQHIPSVLFGYSVGPWAHDTYQLGESDLLERLQN
ncbi:hypothetical protein TIFTF001_012471 [Ficus carica]|uniref:Uncharacterized protein n=1 Tax=Ficus carica TaxID=3494 RepID=A0AA88DI30_FICCA|nr:hypothetical protein TIFTF001_012471 [Ficus carica]